MIIPEGIHNPQPADPAGRSPHPGQYFRSAISSGIGSGIGLPVQTAATGEDGKVLVKLMNKLLVDNIFIVAKQNRKTEVGRHEKTALLGDRSMHVSSA